MKNHPVWHYENQMPEGREFEIYHATTALPQPTIYQSHHFYELYFILRGSIRVIVEEMDICPVLGETLIYPPDCMHRVFHQETSEPYERFYIYLSREFLTSVSTEGYNFIDKLNQLAYDGHNHISCGAQAVLSFVPMIDEIIEAAGDTSPAATLANRCRMTIFLIQLFDILEKNVCTVSDHSSTRMTDLIHYINEHAAEPLSLDSLSETFAVNKYSLLHEFKKYTGMSVYQYILTRRTIMAQQLIQQGVKPGEACDRSGFSDYASFYRVFKARTGKTPTQYARLQSD